MKERLSALIVMVIIGGILTDLISGVLLAYLLALLLVATFFYFVAINNKDRKEDLNIIKDEDKLYFYLSDDLLCKVNINKKRSFTETLKSSITYELLALKGITNKINFINFKNDALLSEVNSKLFLK